MERKNIWDTLKSLAPPYSVLVESFGLLEDCGEKCGQERAYEGLWKAKIAFIVIFAGRSNKQTDVRTFLSTYPYSVSYSSTVFICYHAIDKRDE